MNQSKSQEEDSLKDQNQPKKKLQLKKNNEFVPKEPEKKKFEINSKDLPSISTEIVEKPQEQKTEVIKPIIQPPNTPLENKPAESLLITDENSEQLSTEDNPLENKKILVKLEKNKFIKKVYVPFVPSITKIKMAEEKLKTDNLVDNLKTGNNFGNNAFESNNGSLQNYAQIPFNFGVQSQPFLYPNQSYYNPAQAGMYQSYQQQAFHPQIQMMPNQPYNPRNHFESKPRPDFNKFAKTNLNQKIEPEKKTEESRLSEKPKLISKTQPQPEVTLLPKLVPIITVEKKEPLKKIEIQLNQTSPIKPQDSQKVPEKKTEPSLIQLKTLSPKKEELKIETPTELKLKTEEVPIKEPIVEAVKTVKISFMTNEPIIERKIVPEKTSAVENELKSKKEIPLSEKEAKARNDAIEAELKAIEVSKFRISEEEILHFIENYSAELPAELEILQRKIVNVPNSQKTKFQNPRQEGGKYDRNQDRPKYEKPQNNRLNVQKPANNAPQQPSMARADNRPSNEPRIASVTNLALSRSNFTEERLMEIKKIKEKADHWIANKLDDDEVTKQKKEIQALLNKITMDNFEKISEEIMVHAGSENMGDFLVDSMVEKAWKEPRYTKCYTLLVKKLVSKKFNWDKTMKKTHFKGRILNRVEEEYTEGFTKYYELTRSIHEDTNKTPEEKFEELTKRKMNLIGNVNFISELFEQQILSFFVLKIIVLYGIGNFLKEYVRTEASCDKFSIKEDYLEALIKIFDNVGKIIEKKDVAHYSKMAEGDPSDDHLFDQIKLMLDNTVDRTEKFMEKANLDDKSKRITSLSELFFDFLELLKEKKISMRMISLIENLNQFRNSKWVVEVKRITAAKTLAEVHREEKVEPEERGRYEDEPYEKFVSKGKGPKANSKQDYKKKDGYENEYTPKETNYGNGGSKGGQRYETYLKTVTDFVKANKETLKMDDYYRVLTPSDIKQPKDYIRVFVETFAFILKKNVSQTLLTIPSRMFVDNLIIESDFYEGVQEANKAVYLRACDSAFLKEFLGKIIADLDTEERIYWHKVNLSKDRKDFNNEDDPDEYDFYIQDLKTQIQTHLPPKPN